MTPQDFIAAVSPAATASAKTTKIPASFTVAQGALESAWGAHCPGFNLFGIKATPDWKGPVTTQTTHEVVDGKTITITAKFRAYSDWLGSISDHAQFLLTNPRYQPAFAYTTGALFAQAVAAVGYATDPLYAQKIASIIKAHGLGSLDIT
jgi:flagellum-specific peptidoglycan hydrolase FlgJ